MSKENKLPGFTILEIITVLVITSLLIYLGFLMLSQQRVQLSKFSSYYQQQQELEQCQFQITQLFNQANFIKTTPNGLQFNGKLDSEMEFNKTQIVISFIDDQPSKIYQIGVDQFKISKIAQVVDSLQLTIQTTNNQQYQWYFSKDYDMNTLYRLSQRND